MNTMCSVVKRPDHHCGDDLIFLVLGLVHNIERCAAFHTDDVSPFDLIGPHRHNQKFIVYCVSLCSVVVCNDDFTFCVCLPKSPHVSWV